MAASKAVQTTTKKQRIAKARKAYATYIRMQWNNAHNSIITVDNFSREATDELTNINFLEMDKKVIGFEKIVSKGNFLWT